MLLNLDNITFYQILDFIGTLAFAISGTRLAAAKHFDLFGAYVVGVTTAIGGGTMRDILLNQTPFWMTDPFYLICSAVAVIWVVVFRRHLVRQNNTWFLFDTIGLALFTVVGVEKTLSAGLPMWCAIIMGAMTGAAGGIMRDVLINEVPLIFRKEIYALACVTGGIMFAIGHRIGIDTHLNAIISGLAVIVIRLLAVKYHLALPKLKVEEADEEKDA
ncbi:MAG: trimeric intracellular cation channel family protein [Prevotellaceae bacterium]|nr:trimeric intracellular cation channel family protein [Prevotellaceae bacterium]